MVDQYFFCEYLVSRNLPIFAKINTRKDNKTTLNADRADKKCACA